MKTFEERYTAWIDGQLEGPALTAFELELSRRAAAGEARADKTDAERLRSLLKTELQAPVMTNTEFFSHQLSERIAAERAAERRREQPRARLPLFDWSFARLAGLGGAFLFSAVALYYGLVPDAKTGGSKGTVAQASPRPAPSVQVAANNTPAPAPQPVAPAQPRDPSQPLVVASLTSPTPAPVDVAPADIQKVQVAEPAKNTTTATPLHYQKPDVNVIWINGLEYLPSVPEDSAAPAGQPAAQPAPASPAPVPSAAGTATP